jgi:uncharacterized RDD family membrane protein YckC
MLDPQLQTAQNVAIDVEVAGVGDRALAALIDYALIACYMVVMGLLLGIAGQAPFVVIFLLVLLPVFLYFLLSETLMDGQSLGKWMRGIRVVRPDGQAPSMGDFLLRWLLRPIDIVLTSGCAALLTILITGHGQRLGDLAAGTMVARVQKRASLDDTLLADLPNDHRVTFPGARRLSDEEAATANDVLRALHREDPPRSSTRDLAGRLRDTLAAKINAESDLEPEPFLRTLLADYNAAQNSRAFYRTSTTDPVRTRPPASRR